MSSFDTLSKRVDAVQHKVALELEQREDNTVVDLITASLSRKLAAIGSGSFPAQDEDYYTPEQQAAINRFSRRYNCAGAKDALLLQIEKQIASEEVSA